MKIFILFISFAVLVLVNYKKESINTPKPFVVTPVKNNRIINTYKNPYYERHVNYHDIPISYTDSLNSYNSEGC